MSAIENAVGESFNKQYVDGKLDGTAPLEIIVEEENITQNTKVIILDDVILVYSAKIDNNEVIDYIPSYGFSFKEDYCFVFDIENGEVVPQMGTISASDISDILHPFNFSGNVITQGKKTNTYHIDDGMTNYDMAMQYSYYVSYVNEDGIDITVDGDYITQVEINYYYPGDIITPSSQGVETITFNYQNVTIDQELLNTIRNTDPLLPPATWLEAESDVYQDLVKHFGKEFADSLPYIYDENFAGTWTTDLASDGSFVLYPDVRNAIALGIITVADMISFTNQFCSALQQSGFILEQTINDETYGYTFALYVKNNICVQVCLENIYGGGILIYYI